MELGEPEGLDVGTEVGVKEKPGASDSITEPRQPGRGDSVTEPSNATTAGELKARGSSIDKGEAEARPSSQSIRLSDSVDDEGRDPSSTFRKLSEREYRIFHMLIFGVYATNVFGQDSLIPAMPVIQDDLGFTSGTVAIIASLTDVGMVVGKLTHGWLIDSLGPRQLMLYTFFGLSVALFSLSFLSTVALIALFLAFVTFVGSATDPAEVCVIGNWCAGNPAELSKGIWVLGLSSRFSGLMTILIFAGLLRVIHWRWALRIAAIFPLLGIGITYFFLKDTPSERTKPGRPLAIGALIAAAKNLFKDNLFWFAASVHACAASTRRMDIMFGSYFHEATGVSPEDAAGMVITFPLGVIVGLLGLGTIFRKLKGLKRRLLLTCQWGLVVIGTVGLAMIAAANAGSNGRNLSAAGFAGLFVFLIGLGVSVPYYMVAYSYAAAFGGASIGLTAALIEAIAFLCAALLYLILGVIIQSTGWPIAFIILASIAAIGSLITWKFMIRLELRAEQVPSNDDAPLELNLNLDGTDDQFAIGDISDDEEIGGGIIGGMYLNKEGKIIVGEAAGGQRGGQRTKNGGKIRHTKLLEAENEDEA
eukprot:CAMPEP_0114492298 /NCGR_PEP_ID=MMETSP0109-20121206/3476_1 /TAXON_ID=29199 /ORGANISM="Chlorarachnion reptans, Strain CCCM449" /LENGTH=589 /DNA_ID=CAMNT_0001669123 /DNA_START=50 /DNA_END=1816 /DNA_ORIENTATION=+